MNSHLRVWQDEKISRIRTLIKVVNPKIIEENKWKKPSNSMRGVPTWSYSGVICTGETYKDKIKLTFAKGAFLKDPSSLFNSSLEGKIRRAIDIYEKDDINEVAFKSLIREAVDYNAKE